MFTTRRVEKLAQWFSLLCALAVLHARVLGQEHVQPIGVSQIAAIGQQKQDSLQQRGVSVVSSRNAIYAELLGQGLLYSINYDYRVGDHISLRAGFSYWSIEPFLAESPITGELNITAFPVMVNYLTGEKSSHLELGVGLMPTFLSVHGLFFGTKYSGSGSTVLGTATLGYRLQPRDGGFVFRIGFTPLFTFKKILPYGGLSAGVAF